MNKIIRLFPVFIFMPFFASAQHTNILISDKNSPNEPSIIFNPKHPEFMVAGANLNNYYYSSDSGKTWVSKILTSSFGVWGDPCLTVDTAGNFYFFHLSNPSGSGHWIDRIVCQKSLDNGNTWSAGTFTGLNGTKHQDKHWVAVDPATNAIYATWTQFDQYGSNNINDSSHIMFSKSTNGGDTWTPALRLDENGGDCVDDDNTVEGAVPVVGPNGELYVVWAGPDGLYFDKSLDKGETWKKKDKIISNMPGGWAYDIPGIDRCNGLPVTVCDQSDSPFRGTIYVNWTDQRKGKTDTDVWLIKSSDGGKHWSKKKRVNNDAAGRQQFLTWMAVDQKNGNLYFVFYDRRNYNDSTTDVYMARSKDGGQTFVNFKVSENSFQPNENIFFGDYTNVYAYNNVVRPIWGKNQNGKSSLWTAIVKTSAISENNFYEPIAKKIISKEPEPILQPNPFTNETYISFDIPQKSIVTIDIYDNTGRLIYQPINRNYAYGRYVEKINFSDKNLATGVYYLQLKINNEISEKRMLYIK